MLGPCPVCWRLSLCCLRLGFWGRRACQLPAHPAGRLPPEKEQGLPQGGAFGLSRRILPAGRGLGLVCSAWSLLLGLTQPDLPNVGSDVSMWPLHRDPHLWYICPWDGGPSPVPLSVPQGGGSCSTESEDIRILGCWSPKGPGDIKPTLLRLLRRKRQMPGVWI